MWVSRKEWDALNDWNSRMMMPAEKVQLRMDIVRLMVQNGRWGSHEELIFAANAIVLWITTGQAQHK